MNKAKKGFIPFSVVLTPDGLRFICEANNYDPEAIGRHFLEVLAKMGQR